MRSRALWLLMAILVIGVAGYAIAVLFVPGLRNEFVANLFAKAPAATAGHFAGGVFAIAVGAFQVNARLRGRYLRWHRWLGRLYVLGVMVGGLAAFLLALQSDGGLPAHTGFGLLAVLWIGTTAAAWRAIRRRDLVTHRRWMLRSYALTLAAVTLRVYLLLTQIAGWEFESSYAAISWFCWVPNLLFVEWVLLRQPARVAKGVTA